MQPNTSGVLSTIQAYFDLMYDADDARFREVFHDSCLVHGMRDGGLVAWSASEFRQVMQGRPSPASMGSPREEEIISVDETSPDMAATKVRVRIGQTCFLDHLILHRVDAKWLATAKGFHVERVLPAGK